MVNMSPFLGNVLPSPGRSVTTSDAHLLAPTPQAQAPHGPGPGSELSGPQAGDGATPGCSQPGRSESRARNGGEHRESEGRGADHGFLIFGAQPASVTESRARFGLSFGAIKMVRSGGGRASTGGMAGAPALCKVYDAEAEERQLVELYVSKDAKGGDVFEVKQGDGKLLRPFVFCDVGPKSKAWQTRLVTEGGATLEEYAASIGRDPSGKLFEAAPQAVLATPEKGVGGRHTAESPSDVSIASTAKAASPLDAPAIRGGGGGGGGRGGGGGGNEDGGAAQDEWRKTGNEHIGRNIMRSVLCDNGSGRVSGFSRGVVVGWLPADESDFVSEETGKPAALWHVELEGDLGEEDLEEFELIEAEELYATRKGNVEIDDEDYVELISTKSSTDVPKVAKQYGISARELFLINSLRIEGLRPSSKLRAGTNLLVPLKSMEEDTLLRIAKEYAVRDAAAAEAEAESRRIAGLDAKPELCAEKDGAPNDKVGGGAVTAVGSAEKKPKKSSTKQEEDAPSSSGKGKGRKSEGGDKAKGKSKSGGGADKAGPLSPKKGDKAVAVAAPITQQDLEWHMKLAPSCKFPEYPLPAAEGMPARMAGLLAKHRRPFYCPYYRLNGVIYASQGYHAVAPIVFKVEDKWATCDACDKWRRLPAASGIIVEDGAPFSCGDVGRSCDDEEDAWDDDAEMEVANDQDTTIQSTLPIIDAKGGLEVTAIGEVRYQRGYYTRTEVFPVGYTARRKHRSVKQGAEEGGGKVWYICSILDGGEQGPIFQVKPEDEEEGTWTAQGKTPGAVWWEVMSRTEQKSDKEGRASVEGGDVAMEGREGEGEGGSSPEEGGRESMGGGQGADSRFWDVDEMEGDGEEAGNEDAGAAMEVDDSVVQAEGGEGKSDAGGGGADGVGGDAGGKEDGNKKKVLRPNGTALFGLNHYEVQELIKLVPGYDDVEKAQKYAELKRKQGAELMGAGGGKRARMDGSVEARMRLMPAHMHSYDHRESRVLVRDVVTKIVSFGPKAKDVRGYLVKNFHMECANPSTLSERERKMLEEDLDICWDCKKGMLASHCNSKYTCRLEMGHKGPYWKADPREKDTVFKDPLARLRHGPDFKRKWKEGEIMRLDYNPDDKPLRLLLPKEFVEEALQVVVTWDHEITDDGFQETRIHMAQVTEKKKLPRHIYKRPEWIVEPGKEPRRPPLPEMEEGCARASPYVRKSFSEKAEFTHIAMYKFPRLLSEQENRTMSDQARFTWMKENQPARLSIANSGIEGKGIFAKQPIYAGEFLVEYTGEAVRTAVADMREKRYEDAGIGTYFWRLEQFLSNAEPLEGRPAIVDATIKHNIGHYINHCCDPNCRAEIKNIGGRKRIIISALYDIEFGEELSYDYKLPLEDVKIPCNCGAANCRKFLN